MSGLKVTSMGQGPGTWIWAHINIRPKCGVGMLDLRLFLGCFVAQISHKYFMEHMSVSIIE